MAPAMFALMVACDALLFVSSTSVGRGLPVVFQGKDGGVWLERPVRDEDGPTASLDTVTSSTEEPNLRGWMWERIGSEGFVPPWYWLRRRSADKRSLGDKGFFPTRRHTSLFG
ncbi:PREDICTED: uncharacterized protein LOC109474962 [Branchiostoma belcheri]|uniref:Uncharacterized protein LOC109474962 n=1 Tax=Branchiostoma belcheri TaxID=7741 RepID=A0A6P4Z363_BRABE|nr:PREDICTED: uncharacterized protein LOC109474962 [Branchiostoma belcheri]KAI8481957.1 hypothetical protein Bbelb_403190 [Branchiostoma belcheri]KAI8483268.1 hypothetical protein Bbelb_390090 [Branchiostoma belcheri]